MIPATIPLEFNWHFSFAILVPQQKRICYNFKSFSSLLYLLVCVCVTFTGGWGKDDRVWTTLCIHHQSKEREFSGYGWTPQARYMLCFCISYTPVLNFLHLKEVCSYLTVKTLILLHFKITFLFLLLIMTTF